MNCSCIEKKIGYTISKEIKPRSHRIFGTKYTLRKFGPAAFIITDEENIINRIAKEFNADIIEDYKEE